MRLPGRTTFRATTSLSPEEVYRRLSDARAHLDWGGRRQWPMHKLLSIDSPATLTAGATFRSVGAIPVTTRRFEDTSVVTVAEPPRLFEFVTESAVTRHPMRATFRHRYEIVPHDGGSDVTYTVTVERLAHALARARLPLVREMTWRVAAPFLLRRGFRNLLHP